MNAIANSKRVLIIGCVWPEPNSSAAGQNMLGIIQSFVDEDWHVTFMTAASDSAHKADLSAMGVCVAATALNSAKFDQQIKDIQPSLVIFDRFMTEEQFSWRVKKVCPEAMLLLSTEDLHFLRHARHNAIKAGDSSPALTQDSDITYREVASILRCDLSLIISDVELALLEHKYNVPSTQLLHLPLLLPALHTRLKPYEERHGFVSIGNFRHAPNWEAVLTLKQHIWPQIKKQIPDATLSVYGAYPPKKATDLHSPQTGFLVKGWVADAASALGEARVLLAPLRFGAGVKGKLVLAMQTGTPSITTPIGAEGIADNDRWPGAVSDDWSTFVSKAVAIYNNPEQWQSKLEKAHTIVSTTFNLKRNQQRLRHRVSTVLSDLAGHRRNHFQQNLLWHHTLRSTQYMSQWIEEKNKTKPPVSDR